MNSDTVPLAEAADLLESAARVSGDRDFGLNFSNKVMPGSSGVLGQIQASAPTVRDVVMATEKFSPLAVAASTVTWTLKAEGGTLTPALPLQFGPVRRQLTDLLFAVLLNRIRAGAGEVWYPRQITLMTSRPLDDRMSRNVFGPRAIYAAPNFSIFIENEVLDRPLPQKILGLFETIEPIAEQQLREVRKSTSIINVVRAVVLELLACDETVSLEPVARRLDLSVRALQWKIEREESSFENIVLMVREELADGYLRDEGLTMSEISGRLGFSEPSAFARWVRQNFDMSPTERRRTLLSDEDNSSATA